MAVSPATGQQTAFGPSSDHARSKTAQLAAPRKVGRRGHRSRAGPCAFHPFRATAPAYHRRAAGRFQNMVADQRMDWLERGGAGAGLVGEGRQAEIDTRQRLPRCAVTRHACL